MEAIEWNWNTSDNLKMFARGWLPFTRPKGVVCLVHGLGEHIGRYEHVGKAFSKAGYALLGFDLRGHGKSEGQRGHTPSYQSLMDDISNFLDQSRQRYPGLPLFLYGHSLGGNLVLNYSLRVKSDLQGVIATSPWLELSFQPPASQVNLAKIMVKIIPGFTQPNGLDTSALSRVESVVSAYQKDPLVHDKISANLFLNTYQAGLWALEHASEFSIPLLLIHGTSDRICSVEATRKFAQSAKQKAEAFYFEGWYHETHNEAAKEEVFQVITNWLDKHVSL